MSAAREPVEMARAARRKTNPLKAWWRSKSEIHFQAYTVMTAFSFAALLYCFILLFFMDGVATLTEDGNENLIPLVWIGLVGGSISLFIVAPEFFYYYGKKDQLSEILQLDSRAEVMRLRKEAETAADVLGPSYQAMLKGRYEELGINVPKRYSSLSSKPSEHEAETDSNSGEEE